MATPSCEKETISVVIPCFNSAPTIRTVVDMTRDRIQSTGYNTEFILVNDGSCDTTFDVIEEICLCSDDVVAIDLAKNFGQQKALITGLRFVRGDYVMLMDDDMQTHPSQCQKLIDAMTPEVDVVFARYRSKAESWWRRLGSAFTGWTRRKLINAPKDIVASNFALMRRYVSDHISEYRGVSPIMFVMILQTTSHLVNVDVDHYDRAVGKSGYSLSALLKLWTNVLDYSMVPLRASLLAGLVLSIAGLCIAVIHALNQFSADHLVTIPFSGVLILCGLALLSIGIIGEYTGRHYFANNFPNQGISIRLLIDKR